MPLESLIILQPVMTATQSLRAKPDLQSNLGRKWSDRKRKLRVMPKSKTHLGKVSSIFLVQSQSTFFYPQRFPSVLLIFAMQALEITASYGFDIHDQILQSFVAFLPHFGEKYFL